ncbi:MAG: four helix bundle protein [Ruminococcaceae bacterium]|nr:four helix bundle protein [Oscillospiraceae bacterium]
MPNVGENVIVKKSRAFSVRIVNLYRFMCHSRHEYVLSKQLLRCGTSIGANVAEAQRAQSRADFHAKMSIAQKEAHEAEYWITLLFDTNYLTKQQFLSIYGDLKQILQILSAICKTTRA